MTAHALVEPAATWRRVLSARRAHDPRLWPHASVAPAIAHGAPPPSRRRWQDYNRKEVWVEVCNKLKETRIVPYQGYRKFSAACKFLPMVKQYFPAVPFVVNEFGVVSLGGGFAPSWKKPAWEAIQEVFGVFINNGHDKNEYGKSLGLCIPNFAPVR
eukprot:1740194-Prymnesium_polylepis.1